MHWSLNIVILLTDRNRRVCPSDIGSNSGAKNLESLFNEAIDTNMEQPDMPDRELICIQIYARCANFLYIFN